MFQRMCLFVIFLLLVACGNDNGDTKAGADQEALYNDQIKALEKAKALKLQMESTLLKQKQQMEELAQ